LIEGGSMIRLRGELRLIRRDIDGRILDELRKKNLIVDKGKEIVAKLINGVHTKPFKYIQIGTGTASPTASDTALQSYYAEGEATVSYEADFKCKWAYTFTFNESVSITEAGLFDDSHSASPNMLARQTFSARDMQAGQSLEVIWVIVVG